MGWVPCCAVTPRGAVGAAEQMLEQRRGHFIFRLDYSPLALTALSPFKCDLHISLILWFKYFPRVRE